jgi:hypothetical protein
MLCWVRFSFDMYILSKGTSLYACVKLLCLAAALVVQIGISAPALYYPLFVQGRFGRGVQCIKSFVFICSLAHLFIGTQFM